MFRPCDIVYHGVLVIRDFLFFSVPPLGRYRSVGTATRYGLDGPGIESQ
jgi:hypothetical protein